MDDMDQGPVRQQISDSVLVLTLQNPPVNALGHALRLGLAAGLDRAQADPVIRAVILVGDGRGFSAGADIREFDQPARLPLLSELCRRLEQFVKPVIAAMHGVALGGGLELGLAAHARVGMAGLRLGLPEVTLGLLPGAGGTQRLPRLIGAAAALRMMLGGQPVLAHQAVALGLLNDVAQDMDDLMAKAMRLASAPPHPGARARHDPVVYEAAIAAARREVAASGLAAKARIVDCVEAALLLPPEQGLLFERAAFDDLRGAPEAVALRHIFLAERRADKLPPGIAATASVPVTHLGIWGAGAGAAGLAGAALRAGLKVTLCDPSREALVAALEAVGLAQEAAVTAGHLTPDARDADWARLVPAMDPMALSGAEAVILTDAQRPLAVDFARGLGADIAVLVAGGLPLGAVQDALGVIFAPHAMAEVALTPAVAAGTVATGFGVLRKLGLRPVLTATQGRSPGIGVRVAAAGRRAAQVLIEAGVPFAQAARATAPFLRLPAGLATGLPAGLATGRADGLAHGQGTLLAIQDAAIVDRVLAAMANEGARLLSEGVALRASDIDVLMVGGSGFARTLGGPMHQADRRGIMVVRRNLRIWALEDAIWTPDPLFDVLIAEAQNFASLDMIP